MNGTEIRDGVAGAEAARNIQAKRDPWPTVAGGELNAQPLFDVRPVRAENVGEHARARFAFFKTGKIVVRAVAAVLALGHPALSSQLLACSLKTTWPKVVDNSELILRGHLKIKTYHLSDTKWTGMATLDVTSVKRNPSRVKVPRVIDNPFTVDLASDSCDQWVPDEKQKTFLIKRMVIFSVERAR